MSCAPSSSKNGKSTTAEAQRQKLLVFLRNGSKNTIELRDAGLMMPATRVFELRSASYKIVTTFVTLMDVNWFKHPRCAQYTLMAEPPYRKVCYESQ